MIPGKHLFTDFQGFPLIFQGLIVIAQVAIGTAHIVIESCQIRMIPGKHLFTNCQGFQLIFQGLPVVAQIAIGTAQIVIGSGQFPGIRHSLLQPPDCLFLVLAGIGRQTNLTPQNTCTNSPVRFRIRQLLRCPGEQLRKLAVFHRIVLRPAELAPN